MKASPHITALLRANLDGSENTAPLLLEKYAKQRCFILTVAMHGSHPDLTCKDK
jgi:hypothetical protein